MGCMFQDIDVTSCFDLQPSSNRIFFSEISPRCDPRGLCQEDVPGHPLVELLELTDPVGKPGKLARGLFCKSLALGEELP